MSTTAYKSIKISVSDTMRAFSYTVVPKQLVELGLPIWSPFASVLCFESFKPVSEGPFGKSSACMIGFETNHVQGMLQGCKN